MRACRARTTYDAHNKKGGGGRAGQGERFVTLIFRRYMQPAGGLPCSPCNYHQVVVPTVKESATHIGAARHALCVVL